jgi:hypothetical protein
MNYSFDVPPKCRQSSLQRFEMFAGMKSTSLQRVERVCGAEFDFWMHHIRKTSMGAIPGCS